MDPASANAGSSWPRLLVAGLVVVVAILGIAAVSSVLDHARTHFTNPWLWIPTVVGACVTVVGIGLGLLDRPSCADVRRFVGAMVSMRIVGLTGSYLHIHDDLTSQGAIVGERFVRGAPFLVPVLLCDIGMLGFPALLPPDEAPTPVRAAHSEASFTHGGGDDGQVGRGGLD
jgi:hypothetical protein